MARLLETSLGHAHTSTPPLPSLIPAPGGDLSSPPVGGSPVLGVPQSPPAPVKIPEVGEGLGYAEDAAENDFPLDAPHALPITASANTMIAGHAGSDKGRHFGKEAASGNPVTNIFSNEHNIVSNNNDNHNNNSNDTNSSSTNPGSLNVTKTSHHSSCSTSSTSAASHHFAAWPSDWTASAGSNTASHNRLGSGGGGKDLGSQLQGLLQAHALAHSQAQGSRWPPIDFNDDTPKGIVRGPPPLNNTSEAHPSQRSRKGSVPIGQPSISRENQLLSKDISKAATFAPPEAMPDEDACQAGSWYFMSKLVSGTCTTEMDEEEDLDHEDVEWETRRRLTGAAGRMVQYETGESPRQDFMLRGGIGKRILVSAVAEGGKAHYTGIKAGDVLVSINGSKDFLGLSAQEVHSSLRSPVTLVFLGFVGKLQAEVRLNHRSRTLGLRTGDPLLANFGDYRVQVTDEVVFKPEKASLMIASGASTTGSTVSPVPSLTDRRVILSQTGSGQLGGHEQGDDGIMPESESEDEDPREEVDEDDDDDEEDVMDIDAIVAARSASNVSKATSAKAARDAPGVYELHSQDARRILKNVLVESNNTTITLTNSVALF